MNISIVVFICVKAQRVSVVFPNVPCGFVSVQTPRDVKAHADATTPDGLVIFDNGLTYQLAESRQGWRSRRDVIKLYHIAARQRPCPIISVLGCIESIMFGPFTSTPDYRQRNCATAGHRR